MAYTYFIAVVFASLIAFGLSSIRTADEQLAVRFSDIKDVDTLSNKLEFCRYIIANHTASEEMNGILNGLIDIHYQEMDNQQKRKLMGLLSELNNSVYQKEEIREFIKFIHEKYLSGIQKFKDNNLLVSYCFFLKETDTSINKKKKIAEHSALIVKGFFSSYEIYCLSQYADDGGKTEGSKRKKRVVVETGEENREGLETSKQAKLFYALLLKSVKASHRLINILSDESPAIEDLLEAYQEVGQRKQQVQKQWAKHQTVLKKNYDVLERYGIFVKHVLHNNRQGERLLHEARNLQQKEKNIGGKMDELDLKTLIEKISQISHPILILKFEQNEIVIENCNQSFCSLIRYKKFEILEKSSQD